MKTIYIILIFLLLSNTLLQSQGGSPAPQQVIFLGIFGLNPTDTRNFTTTAQGTVWGKFLDDPFSISEEESNEPPYQSTYQQTGNSDISPTTWGGWDNVTKSSIPEVIGYGFYKITTDDSPAYFYYNTRDCHFAYACGDWPPNYNADGFFEYLADLNKFQYKIREQPQFIDITNGQLINSWDMLNNGILPSTNGFEDFWVNALVLVNNGSNRPLLVWGPYPDSFVLFYLVYRDEDGLGNFTHIATVNNSTFSYTDNSVIMDQPGQKIYYKVKAFGKEFTNTVSTTIIPFKIGTGKYNEFSYVLNQNYPNPFNPATKITYTLAANSHVSLKVYDLLGNEVAALVNERKPAGYYSVEFDAGNLPSGIYFYTVTSGNFTYTRKMILLR